MLCHASPCNEAVNVFLFSENTWVESPTCRTRSALVGACRIRTLLFSHPVGCVQFGRLIAKATLTLLYLSAFFSCLTLMVPRKPNANNKGIKYYIIRESIKHLDKADKPALWGNTTKIILLQTLAMFFWNKSSEIEANPTSIWHATIIKQCTHMMYKISVW